MDFGHEVVVLGRAIQVLLAKPTAVGMKSKAKMTGTAYNKFIVVIVVLSPSVERSMEHKSKSTYPVVYVNSIEIIKKG
jgi:hypothetical protein